MINDIFIRRYPNQIYWGDRPTGSAQRFFMQVAHIIYNDVAPALQLDQNFYVNVHDILARELGRGRLFNALKPDEICGQFLTEVYDLWNDRHGTADIFLKERLSLIEIIFRSLERQVATPVSPSQKRPASLFSRNRPPADISKENIELVAAAIRELNDRFRQADMGLHYHNGFIQFSHDKMTEQKITEPCWEILRDPLWINVDRELKEAIDHADSGRADAPFYAAKALESTIKIISDVQGWTTGKERGAANYIDNLVSQKNGRFIDVWEGEILKNYFMHVRNPHGHGAGSQPPPQLSEHQKNWAIETAMSWIKSLTRRL